MAQEEAQLEALLEAAKASDFEAVKNLLIENPDIYINIKDFDDITCLHYAAGNGRLDIFDFLFQKGANIKARCSGNYSVLHIAAMKTGDKQFVTTLMEKYQLSFDTELERLAFYGDSENFEKIFNSTPAIFDHQAIKKLAMLAAAGANDRIFVLLEEYIDLSEPYQLISITAQISTLAILKYFVKRNGLSVLNEKDNDGDTVLLAASRNGCLDTVKWIVGLLGKKSLCEKDENGKTAIFSAANTGRFHIVKWIVEQLGSESLRESSINGNTVLSVAVAYGHFDTVKLIVEKLGIECLNDKDDDGCTVVMLAVKWGNFGIVKWIVELLGKNCLKAKNKDGESVLMLRATRNVEFISKWIVGQLGADCFKDKDRGGNSVLIRVAERGYFDLVKLIVEQLGKDSLNDKNQSSGETAVYYAAGRGNLEVVTWIVEQLGTDCLKVKDNDGNSILMAAASGGHFDVVKWLVKLLGKESLREINHNGESVLQAAIFHGHFEIAKWIVEQLGTDCLKEKNKDGNTALIVAAGGWKFNIVKWIVELLGKECLREKNNGKYYYLGDTTLLFAVEGGNLEDVIWIVEQLGKDCLKERYSEGNTLLHVAMRRGYVEIAKWIIEQLGKNCLKEKNDDGESPVIVAVQMDKLEVLQWMVAQSDLSILCDKDKNNFSCLSHAAIKGYLHIIIWIVNQLGKKCLKEINESGFSILTFAAANDQLHVVRWIVEQIGIDSLKTKDNWQRTILFHASYKGVNTFKWIVNRLGMVSLTCRDIDGNTPSLEAAARSNLGVLKWLVTVRNSKTFLTDERNNSRQNMLICAVTLDLSKKPKGGIELRENIHTVKWLLQTADYSEEDKIVALRLACKNSPEQSAKLLFMHTASVKLNKKVNGESILSLAQASIEPQFATWFISAEAWYLRGEFFENKGIYPVALKSYRRALKYDAHHIPTRIKYIELLIKTEISTNLQVIESEIEHLSKDILTLTPQERSVYFLQLLNILRSILKSQQTSLISKAIRCLNTISTLQDQLIAVFHAAAKASFTLLCYQDRKNLLRPILETIVSETTAGYILVMPSTIKIKKDVFSQFLLLALYHHSTLIYILEEEHKKFSSQTGQHARLNLILLTTAITTALNPRASEIAKACENYKEGDNQSYNTLLLLMVSAVDTALTVSHWCEHMQQRFQILPTDSTSEIEPVVVLPNPVLTVASETTMPTIKRFPVAALRTIFTFVAQFKPEEFFQKAAEGQKSQLFLSVNYFLNLNTDYIVAKLLAPLSFANIRQVVQTMGKDINFMGVLKSYINKEPAGLNLLEKCFGGEIQNVVKATKAMQQHLHSYEVQSGSEKKINYEALLLDLLKDQELGEFLADPDVLKQLISLGASLAIPELNQETLHQFFTALLQLQKIVRDLDGIENIKSLGDLGLHLMRQQYEQCFEWLKTLLELGKNFERIAQLFVEPYSNPLYLLALPIVKGILLRVSQPTTALSELNLTKVKPRQKNKALKAINLPALDIEMIDVSQLFGQYSEGGWGGLVDAASIAISPLARFIQSKHLDNYLFTTNKTTDEMALDGTFRELYFEGFSFASKFINTQWNKVFLQNCDFSEAVFQGTINLQDVLVDYSTASTLLIALERALSLKHCKIIGKLTLIGTAPHASKNLVVSPQMHAHLDSYVSWVTIEEQKLYPVSQIVPAVPTMSVITKKSPSENTYTTATANTAAESSLDRSLFAGFTQLLANTSTAVIDCAVSLYQSSTQAAQLATEEKTLLPPQWVEDVKQVREELQRTAERLEQQIRLQSDVSAHLDGRVHQQEHELMEKAAQLRTVESCLQTLQAYQEEKQRIKAEKLQILSEGGPIKIYYETFITEFCSSFGALFLLQSQVGLIEGKLGKVTEVSNKQTKSDPRYGELVNMAATEPSRLNKACQVLNGMKDHFFAVVSKLSVASKLINLAPIPGASAISEAIQAGANQGLAWCDEQKLEYTHKVFTGLTPKMIEKMAEALARKLIFAYGEQIRKLNEKSAGEFAQSGLLRILASLLNGYLNNFNDMEQFIIQSIIAIRTVKANSQNKTILGFSIPFTSYTLEGHGKPPVTYTEDELYRLSGISFITQSSSEQYYSNDEGKITTRARTHAAKCDYMHVTEEEFKRYFKDDVILDNAKRHLTVKQSEQMASPKNKAAPRHAFFTTQPKQSLPHSPKSSTEYLSVQTEIRKVSTLEAELERRDKTISELQGRLERLEVAVKRTEDSSSTALQTAPMANPKQTILKPPASKPTI